MRGRIRLQSVLRFGLFWRSFAKDQKGIADPEGVGEMVLARIGTRTRSSQLSVLSSSTRASGSRLTVTSRSKKESNGRHPPESSKMTLRRPSRPRPGDSFSDEPPLNE